MKSGVAMITASIFLPSLSSIFRKSVYFAAFSNRLNMAAARALSGSANATIFSVGAQPLMSSAARPPAPIEAILSFSLGDLKPAALSEGVLPNPPAGTAQVIRAPWKKCRLENPLVAMGRLYATMRTRIRRENPDVSPLGLDESSEHLAGMTWIRRENAVSGLKGLQYGGPGE